MAKDGLVRRRQVDVRSRRRRGRGLRRGRPWSAPGRGTALPRGSARPSGAFPSAWLDRLTGNLAWLAVAGALGAGGGRRSRRGALRGLLAVALATLVTDRRSRADAGHAGRLVDGVGRWMATPHGGRPRPGRVRRRSGRGP